MVSVLWRWPKFGVAGGGVNKKALNFDWSLGLVFLIFDF